MAVFMSTTEPTTDERSAFTSDGAKSTPIFTTSVLSSGAVTIWSTFSGVQPN